MKTFTHLVIGRTDEGISVLLMNGSEKVGGTPPCSVKEACEAVRIVFGEAEGNAGLIPLDPERIYGDQWKGWDDFLGRNKVATPAIEKCS